MRARTSLKRQEKRLYRSVQALSSGDSYRTAEKNNCTPKSTLWDCVNRSSRTSRPRNSLNPAEEGMIVELITTFAHKGVPLNCAHLTKAAVIVFY